MEGTIPQHPPAVKVGGRRLSISTKQKAPTHAEHNSPQTPQKEADTTPSDYPRPHAPDTNNEVPPHREHHRNEEDSKKDRNDKKIQESSHWKAETTRPTRDIHAGKQSHGMGIRIAQPSGKGLGV